MKSALRGSVVLTQPALRVAGLRDALSHAGYAVLHWPMSVIEPIPGVDWATLRRELAACQWVLFPSPGAIDVVMQRWVDCAWPWPVSCGIGLIGPGSREALQAWMPSVAGLREAPLLEPPGPVYDADALLACPALQQLQGVAVAVLRRHDGRQAWLDTLRARGAALRACEVYQVQACSLTDDAALWLAQRQRSGESIVFSIASGEAGRALADAVAGQPYAAWTRSQAVLTQHPRIAARLSEQGWSRVIEHPPGLSGLLRALESASS